MLKLRPSPVMNDSSGAGVMWIESPIPGRPM